MPIRELHVVSGCNLQLQQNKVTELESNSNSVLDYINGTQTREGKPMNSMYSVRWAGLDEKGAPQAYKKDGTIVKSITDLTVDDLVYCGTITPPYAASLVEYVPLQEFELLLAVHLLWWA